MRLIAITFASAAAIALAGCGQKQAETTTVENTTTTSTVNDSAPVAPVASGGQAFANTAAASDAFEIESSKLALATTNSASVKKFAQMMVDAHTASTADLKTAAAAASPQITPDPTLTADQTAKLSAMKGLTGTAFDQAYIAAQTAGHQQTLDALRAYGASGDVPALKTFATNLAPKVAAHLNMAKSLKA